MFNKYSSERQCMLWDPLPGVSSIDNINCNTFRKFMCKKIILHMLRKKIRTKYCSYICYQLLAAKHASTNVFVTFQHDVIVDSSYSQKCTYDMYL